MLLTPPSVTNCHTFSDPLPLERDVLYGRPLTLITCTQNNSISITLRTALIVLTTTGKLGTKELLHSTPIHQHTLIQSQRFIQQSTSSKSFYCRPRPISIYKCNSCNSGGTTGRLPDCVKHSQAVTNPKQSTHRKTQLIGGQSSKLRNRKPNRILTKVEHRTSGRFSRQFNTQSRPTSQEMFSSPDSRRAIMYQTASFFFTIIMYLSQIQSIFNIIII